MMRALEPQTIVASRVGRAQRGLLSHWSALVLAIMIGFLTVFPSLLAGLRLGVDFDHPLNVRDEEEAYYLARVREVIDGHRTIGNAYLWEHKSKPSAQFLGEWLLAQPVKLFGLSVVGSGVLYEFLLPLFAALLTYVCALLITRSEAGAGLVTALLFLGLFPGSFGRAVSPQFNFIFWLGEFLLLWLLVERAENGRERLILTLLAAIGLSLLIYLYPWYPVFYVSLLGIFGALQFLRGRRSLTPWLVAISGLVFAIPYFLLLTRVARLPEYAETVRRVGLVESHFPSGLTIVAVALALLWFALALARKRVVPWNSRLELLVSGLIAAIVSTNVHVVSGQYFQFAGHFHMQAIFWFTFSAAFLITEIWRHIGRWRAVTLVVTAAVTFAAIAAGLPKFWERLEGDEPRKAEVERYVPVLDWIARHTSRDDVVYAPMGGTTGRVEDQPGLAELIPIYTHANVYFAYYAFIFPTSNAEILDRFILNHYYEKLDRDHIIRRFLSIYGIYYLDHALRAAQENRVRTFLGLPLKSVDLYPQENVERALDRARELRSMPFDRELRRFRVDFVVWDEKRSPAGVADSFPFLRRVYAHDGIVIYRMRPL